MQKPRDMMEFLAVPREDERDLLYLRGGDVHPDCGQKDHFGNSPENAEEIQMSLKIVREKLENFLNGLSNTCFGRTPCWPDCVLECGARKRLFALVGEIFKDTSPDVGTI